MQYIKKDIHTPIMPNGVYASIVATIIFINELIKFRLAKNLKSLTPRIIE